MGPGNHNKTGKPSKAYLPVTERQFTLLHIAIIMKYHSSQLDEYLQLKKYLEQQKKILFEDKKPRI